MHLTFFGMANKIIIDENQLNKLPIRNRLDACTLVLKNETDESSRFDAVWLAGDIAADNTGTPIFNEVADLMAWVLENDKNGVVKHEACYQIAALDMREKIPNLTRTALNDRSIIARHEAIEALGLMGVFDSKELLSQATNDPNPEIQETAWLVIKRLQRLEKLMKSSKN